MADLTVLQPLVSDAFGAFEALWLKVKSSTDEELKQLVVDAHHTTRAAFDQACIEFDVDPDELIPENEAARSGPHDKPET